MLLARTAAAMAAAALFLAAPGAASAATPIPVEEKVAPDPAVKTGTLPNGLRYFLMQNATPAGTVSIRLMMNVGSYVEEDRERGFAHFVEHMAFRSTKRAPQGVLDNRFATLGVAIGRDQNAATSLLATTYRVDLPTGTVGSARTILEWMRDAADGIVFTPEAVELERGVVLAEKEARNSSTAEVQVEVGRFQGQGTRTAERLPIGTEEMLRGATPAALQAFYDRWYRPENATIVIVGAVPAAEMERLVRETFGSWAGRGAAGPRPSTAPALPSRSLEAFTRSHSGAPETLSACRMSAPDPDRGKSLEGMRRETYSHLWTSLLNKRLVRAALTKGSPVLGGAAMVERSAPDFTGTCVIAVPAGGRWKEALATAQAELRRFVDQGPTATEVEDAIDTMRLQLAGQTLESGSRTSAALADQIALAALDGRSFATPEEAARLFEILVEGVTAADIKAAVGADWRGNGPLLVAVGPKAPSQEDLLAAWRGNEQAAPLGDYADAKEAVWLYSDFGKRGKVKKRERVANPAFTRFTFKNGVVLNFRRTDFEPGTAEIRVRFGHGERAMQKKERVIAQLAAGLFPAGGLGKMDYQEIASLFPNYAEAVTLSVDTDAFVLRSNIWSTGIADQAQLLAAFLTDPGFGSYIDEKLPTGMEIAYRMHGSDPVATATAAFEEALFPDQRSMPPPEETAAIRASTLERLLKPALISSPLQVTIVGDISEKAAVRAIASTFGALPPRPPLPPLPADAPFRRFPKTLPASVSTTHSGPAEKAAALLVWPLFVASPERRREEYAIGLVSSILETRLLDRVRVKMGKVYSPHVGNVMPDYGDQGIISVAIETLPVDLEGALAAAREVAWEMADGAIGQDEVDKARIPAIAARRPAQASNSAWAAVLSLSLRRPAAVRELFHYEADLNAVTLEDVRKAAAAWLSREPMIATSRPQRPGGGAAKR